MVNYQSNASNSNNYSTLETSSSPESFPELVGNSVFIEYRQLNYTSLIIKGIAETKKDEIDS
jgi:hypothetical protein